MTETVTIHFIHSPSREKRDCFAYSSEQYDRDGGCVICKPLLCEADGKCPFYKPKIERRQK